MAFVLTGRYEGREGVRRLLRRGLTLCGPKNRLVPILFFWPALAGLAFLVTKLAGGNTAASPLSAQPWMVGPMFLFMFFASGALGEEFGWRGFALDRLQAKSTALVSGLVLGLVWSLWHLPLHFIPGTTQSAIPIWQFWAITTVGSVFYTWVHNNTGGSVLAAMLFHAMSNLSVWMFPYWQTDLGRYIGFGVVGAALAVVVLVWGPTHLARRPPASDSLPIS